MEYLWIYGLADRTGSFELTSLRSIWGKLSAIRPNFGPRKLEKCLSEYERYGLLFVWSINNKVFGHWVGSRLPGRLPPPSQAERYMRLCPEPPRADLDAYISRCALDKVKATSGLGPNGFGLGLGWVKGEVKVGVGFGVSVAAVVEKAAENTAAKAAAVSLSTLSNSETETQNQEKKRRQIERLKAKHPEISI